MGFVILINLLGLFLVAHSGIALWQNIKARDTKYIFGFVIYLLIGLYFLWYALLIDYRLFFV
ncbi:MAG: hypothetical protein M3342_16895 [Bacteroidota bacterium]|nr:hypothetical protein [Bacteroidota bacterium]